MEDEENAIEYVKMGAAAGNEGCIECLGENGIEWNVYE